jgi:hypothetical protein
MRRGGHSVLPEATSVADEDRTVSGGRSPPDRQTNGLQKALASVRVSSIWRYLASEGRGAAPEARPASSLQELVLEELLRERHTRP